MKIQGLAVIAIIIILPMSIILNSYSQNQIKTLSLQSQYDSKLQNATYDAIKAFQLNMSNSTTSDLANSKMRDIEASVNTFYNSLASNFNMAGYGEDVLKNYVPAIVYTLYDGYYIYSAYDNTLDEENLYGDLYKPGSSYNPTYTEGNIYGLKPYIYYSCRYKPNDRSDFVITYSLDSYITIQGTIDGEPVNKSGYLLSGVTKNNDGSYSYKGVKIEEESLSEEYVYVPGASANSNTNEKNIDIKDSDGTTYRTGAIKLYPCKKVNGVKYYFENLGQDDAKVFTMLNDEQIYQNDVSVDTVNNNAIKYYEEAFEFREWVKTVGNGILMGLTTNDAVDAKGIKYSNPDYGKDNPFPIERKIFKELENDWWSDSKKCIEDSGSEFNAHRIEVIRDSIESNLMVAIANYNKVSTSGVNFQMPKLTDTDWEELTKNVSMITFLQGLSIGGKIYNGYSIVRNDITEDFVSEDSIYMCYANWDKYYKITDPDLVTKVDPSSLYGILNVNFERKSTNAIVRKDLGDGNTETLTKTIYYYPRADMASYSSIINCNNGSNTSANIQEYFNKVGFYNQNDLKYRLAQKYYTALGRERYGMYRVTNKLEDVQEYLRTNGY